MEGVLNGFRGEAYFYLRTDKKPEMDNETCYIAPVCGEGGDIYYLVKVMKPEFSFGLKEK